MNAFMQFAEIVSKECSLSEMAKEHPGKSMDYKELDKPIDKSFRDSFLPKSGGEWTGERGNSEWRPVTEKGPEKSNPNGQTWGDILKEYGIDGITFKDGEPDFSEISRSTVEIEGFSENRDKNFSKADEAEAEKRGCSPEDVRKWREENNHTWHERKDCKTMDKVPSEVHNNIPHAGGISEQKKINSDKEVQ